MARNIIRWTALIIPLVAFTGIVGSAKDNVEIRLYGHFFAEPATVQLVVAIEPDADNRTLRVEADGDNMFRATESRRSPASNEQRLHTVQFKNLSAGGYTLRAQVLSNQAVRSQADPGNHGDRRRNGAWRLVIRNPQVPNPSLQTQ